MKSKRLIQILVVFFLMFSTFGGSHSVLASTNSAPQFDAMVINRNLDFWNATYFGFVNDSIHERWFFDFSETHTFVVSVSAITGDLIPLLTLQDVNGNDIAQGIATVNSTQPAGSYSIQVEPSSGSGFYVLTLREVVQTQPSVVTTVSPGSVNVGETAVATVTLNNIPAGGYTSAEFTCTYDPNLVTVGSPIVTSLFGADPAVAVNGPQNGSFIVAIAGSNGNKATTDGAAFSFSVTGLVAGQSPINCEARVSTGNNALTSITSTGDSLTVTGSGPTATFTSTPTPADTATPNISPTATSLTPVDTATPTSLTPVDTATPTSLTPVDTATPTSLTPVDTATPTSLTPVDTATPTAPPVDTATPTSLTPVDTDTPTSTIPPDTATPSFTPVPSDTPTLPPATETATPSFTPVPSATLTSTPLPDGTVSGQVLAAKPVTVSLYDGSNNLVTSVTANPDGTFSLSAPAGDYTLRATASGFLTAQGAVTLTSGNTLTKAPISLLAGDIDNNNVIDQLDALTIGMSYNTATPAAADLNNDGVINVLDLELLARNYRQTGPVAWP
jgi:carboxypeptidase family protein/cohesin domain-containing protein/dockerin type I repeat protein